MSRILQLASKYFVEWNCLKMVNPKVKDTGQNRTRNWCQFHQACWWGKENCHTTVNACNLILKSQILDTPAGTLLVQLWKFFLLSLPQNQTLLRITWSLYNVLSASATFSGQLGKLFSCLGPFRQLNILKSHKWGIPFLFLLQNLTKLYRRSIYYHLLKIHPFSPRGCFCRPNHMLAVKASQPSLCAECSCCISCLFLTVAEERNLMLIRAKLYSMYNFYTYSGIWGRMWISLCVYIYMYNYFFLPTNSQLYLWELV